MTAKIDGTDTKSTRTLFGTDGIRGVAGDPPLDADTLYRIGWALFEASRPASRKLRVVLGRDTRSSGDWIVGALSRALRDCGVEVACDTGIISTPGLAFITKSQGFDLGIMVSASHNPYQDNGIKVFGPDGLKLQDDQEIEVEALISRCQPRMGVAVPIESGQKLPIDGYLTFLKSQVTTTLASLRIGLDVCNGSAFRIAPQVFRDLGAWVEIINDSPDGRNINLNCGSLHMSGLAALVTGRQLDFGVAFDGDADRSLFITSSGRVFDGDGVLYALALHMKERGELRGNKVVGTIMSNYALERALADQGLELLRAPVGDRYVLDLMKSVGANLGGEPSGHVILSDCHTAGDGILTALKLAELLALRRGSLDALADGFVPYPQVLDGLRVSERLPLDTPAIAALIERAKSQLNDSGRLVIRYSGTEPLLRIMAEGEDAAFIRGMVHRLKRDIQSVLEDRCVSLP